MDGWKMILSFWMASWLVRTASFMECTPLKTNMTMEKQPFEDVSIVSPSKNGDGTHFHVSFRVVYNPVRSFSTHRERFERLGYRPLQEAQATRNLEVFFGDEVHQPTIEFMVASYIYLMILP